MKLEKLISTYAGTDIIAPIASGLTASFNTMLDCNNGGGQECATEDYD